MGGLILSVAVLVVVVSIINGFERELRERVMGVLPHIVAESDSGLSRSSVDRVLQAQPYPGLVGLAPYIRGTVLLAAQGKIHGAEVTAVDPESYPQVTDLPRYTHGGALSSLNQERYGIILGARLAAKLGVQPGDNVLVILPLGSVTPAGAIPRQRRFTVVDLFSSQSQIDGHNALISLNAGQRLFRMGTKVHGLQGRLNNLFELEVARTELYRALGRDNVRVRSWVRTQGNLYEAIAVQKVTMFVLLSFLVAVAAFNLVSGLMMIVEQRKNDVAVLRTLGAASGTIIRLFCALGLFLAVSGIVMGILSGAAFALALPVVFNYASQALELNIMSQYFIGYLPVDVRMIDLAWIAAAALGLSLMATIYPAWQASRLLPSRVLAHE